MLVYLINIKHNLVFTLKASTPLFPYAFTNFTSFSNCYYQK